MSYLFRFAALFCLLNSSIVPKLRAEPLSEVANEDEPMTNVSQLRDVVPTDWAYSALEALIANYRCLSIEAEGNYRGKQTLTRAEFSEILAACLANIEGTGNFSPQDLPTVTKLRQEFILDLALLRGNTDAVETRIQDMEAVQFSPTAKLNGTVNFALTERLATEQNEGTTLQQRINLDITNSFTGRDFFKLRLSAGNSKISTLADGSAEIVQAQQYFGDTENRFQLTHLAYSFLIDDHFLLTVTPVGGVHGDYSIAPINPFLDDNNRGTTTLSVFAQKNSIDSLGGGTGLGLIYRYDDTLSFGVGYYGATGFDSASDRGLFDGTYTAGVKLRWQPEADLTLSLNYQHGYFRRGDFAFDSNGQILGFAPNLGTAVVNDTLAEFPTITNSYGGEFFWRINSQLGLGGWLGYTQATAIDRGDGEIWHYALSLVFPDLGKEGNLGGIVFGAQPYLASFTDSSQLPNDTPLHLELFYRYQLFNSLSLTSGLIWQLAPNQNADNEDIVTAIMRMTFSF
jgi:hypothetical protein